MANDFTAFTPQIWARQSVAILRERCVMPRLVNLDFSPDPSQAGDTVNTRKPAKFSAASVSTTTGITISDASATNIAIALDKHRHVAFIVKDREQSYSIENLASRFLDPAMLALAVDVDSYLCGLYTDIPAGNTITATSAQNWITQFNSARTKLNKKKAEASNRYAVLSADDEGNLSATTQLGKVNEAGTTETLREGSVGRLKGFDVFMSSNTAAVSSPAVRKNLLFQRDAFALAIRPLVVAAGIAPGVYQAVGIDQDAGLALRVTISYNTTLLATQVVVDILFGVKTLDTDRAVLVNASF